MIKTSKGLVMIIDCFPFFDELDLLEIRLNELKDIVDVFVLTESPLTFSGNGKPLHFRNNQDRFKAFNVCHTIYNNVEQCDPMERERRQKQYNIDAAFKLFTPGDILIQGDVDEIPRATSVIQAVKSGSVSTRLVMRLFYYFLNCEETEHKERVYKNSRVLRPEGKFKYNVKQNDKTESVLFDAGWHFSFLGDIREKIKAWGHCDLYDKPPYNTKEHIQKCKAQGKDIFMRGGHRRMNFKFTEDLSYLPKYVLSNMDKFDRYIHHG